MKLHSAENSWVISDESARAKIELGLAKLANSVSFYVFLFNYKSFFKILLWPYLTNCTFKRYGF